MKKLTEHSILAFAFTIVHFLGYSQYYPVKYGWSQSNGKRTECQNCDTTFHSDNETGLFIKHNTYGFVKFNDAQFTSKSYLALTEFNYGHAMAKTADGWFLIDSTEKKIKKIDCHFAYAFKDGLARIQLGNRFGFINLKGEITVPVQYYGAFDFNEGMARVYNKGKWGFIDTKGSVKVALKYDYVHDFSEGRAPVMRSMDHTENWGYIDITGKEVIGLIYGYVFPFNSGAGIVRKGDYFNGKLKIINTEGGLLYECLYKDIYPFSNGMACVMRKIGNKELWGFINTKNELVIDAIYETPSNFKGDLALVKKDGNQFYIDKSGKIIITL